MRKLILVAAVLVTSAPNVGATTEARNEEAEKFVFCQTIGGLFCVFVCPPLHGVYVIVNSGLGSSYGEAFCDDAYASCEAPSTGTFCADFSLTAISSIVAIGTCTGGGLAVITCGAFPFIKTGEPAHDPNTANGLTMFMPGQTKVSKPPS